jgi:hypothetical protein
LNPFVAKHVIFEHFAAYFNPSALCYTYDTPTILFFKFIILQIT